MRHLLTLALFLSAGPAGAQQVLVPEFTPHMPEDFTLSYMFYSLTTDAMTAKGISFVDGGVLRDRLGEEADNCSESITCPSSLWAFYPDASLAVVGSVGLVNSGMADEAIEVNVEFYDRDGLTALKSVSRTLTPGQEPDYADALATATEVLLERATRATADATPDDEPRSARKKDKTRKKEKKSEKKDRKKKDRMKKGDDEETSTELYDEENLYKAYYDVENEGDDDKRRGREPRQPRTERVKSSERGSAPARGASRDHDAHHLLGAQAYLGLAMGDVSRSYDVRISAHADSGSDLGHYEHDSLIRGAGFDLGLGVVFRPTPWLEGGLRVGFTTGKKLLSTGWETWQGGLLADEEVQEYHPSSALRGLFEPRIQVAPVALGAFRPSVALLYCMRSYDAFEVADIGTVSYPNRTGGWLFSPGAALGVSWELGSGRAVLAELSHVRLARGGETHHVDRGTLSAELEQPEAANATTRINVGFTQRFIKR